MTSDRQFWAPDDAANRDAEGRIAQALLRGVVDTLKSNRAVVPVFAGQASAQALQADGMRVEWHAYPMAHQVCAEEIRDLGDWLSARFATGAG